MKINISNLLTAIAIPLATGGLSAWLTRDGMNAFSSIRQPPLSPPMWIFPVVWILLYLLMGVASYLAAEAGASTNAFILYALQLFFNFFWSIWFFRSWLVSLCLPVAACSVGAHSCHSRLFLPRQQTCRISDSSLSSLGYFRGILKSRRISVPVNIRLPLFTGCPLYNPDVSC